MDKPCEVCKEDRREIGGVLVNGRSLCYPCIAVCFEVILSPNGIIDLEKLQLMRGVSADPS